MTCPVCGLFADPDPETGYDADDICPTCQRLGWSLTAGGTLICDGPIPRAVVEPEDEECPI